MCGWIAVFEGRIALAVRIAIAGRCPAVLLRVADLPDIAVGICPAPAFGIDAEMGVRQVAGLERIVCAFVHRIAITFRSHADLACGVAELPGWAVAVVLATAPASAACASSSQKSQNYESQYDEPHEIEYLVEVL